jgi:putative spermidine/putrescine transport system permease protein
MRTLFLVFVGAVYVFLSLPLVFVLISSFGSSSLLVFPPQSFTIDWYFRIPQPFFDSLWISIKVATVTALVAAALGCGVAMAAIRYPSRWNKSIANFGLVPLSVPHIVLGVAFYQTSGLLWDITGLSLAGSSIGLIMAHSIIAMPYVVRAVIAGHAHYNETLEDAARGLGASYALTIRKVTLPILMPAIVSGGFFAFLSSFDEVPVTIFMGGTSDTATLPIRILNAVQYDMDPSIMAISSIVIVASFALMMLIDRFIGLEKFFGGGRS